MTLLQLHQHLSQARPDLEQTRAWPARQLHWLAEAGLLRWGLPEEYGGLTVTTPDFLAMYRDLACACLSTTFVLTQRNAACQRIVASPNDTLKQALLPELASGKLLTTVGISHLTTSRQHGNRPAVQVEETSGGWVLNGVVPWVTGAAWADVLVVGGTLKDRRQVLVALPRETPGVTIEPSAELMALTSSQTASVQLQSVHVPEKWLIAGPVEGVMNQSGGGAGSLVTSALALGVAQRAILHLQTEASQRSELRETSNAFRHEFDDVQKFVDRAASADLLPAPANVPSSAEVRQRANSLALRSTQALLAVSKGAGFVQGHPAEQAVREAMFFLVWSCPQPVVAAVLAELSCSDSL
jgi:alkylation response protein AidB-like acyl-CoA dehydrogenase